MAAMELVAAEGDEHQRTHPRQAASEMVEQLATRVVGPMDVLDHEQ